jgi:4,5-dihydroxyphthalate decarboxylase
MTIDITVACHDYQWTQPLWDGRVEPDGVNLTTVNYSNPVRFTRMVRNLEFDACEMSMGTYLASRSRSAEFPFTAIPVFPFRKFRHSYMYRRDGAGIDSPRDLEGRRIGIVNWQTTTGIWQRGILRDEYGVDTTSIDWVAAGSEIIDVDRPTEYDVEYLDRQENTIWILQHMLDEGEIDGIFHPVDADTPNAKRLFEEPVAEEREYYRETGIFPIMHAIVLKDELLEDHPWLVQPLYEAFERAKEIGLQVLDRPRELPLVWADVYADEQREVLGEDPWEYGLTEDNVRTLETLIEYADEQGVSAQRYGVDELFATETLNTEWYG